MKTLDEHLDEVWEQMIEERREAILLLQDDLDKYLETYVKEGGDRSWGKIIIYENFDYHVKLLRDGKIPSYSENPKKWYDHLLSLEDWEYLSEWFSYSFLEDEAIGDDVLEMNGDYYHFYMEFKSDEELNK